MGVSPEFLLDLFLKPYQQELDGHQNMAPVGGVCMILAAVSVRIRLVHIMTRLPGLALQHLWVIIYIKPNTVKNEFLHPW